MPDKNYEKVCGISRKIDAAVAEELAISITQGMSYEMIEAKRGAIPTSKSNLYRSRRKVKKILENEK